MTTLTPVRDNDQTATIARPVTHNGKNYGDDKRMLSAHSLLALGADGSLSEVVTVRTFGALRGGGSRNYASLWAHGNGFSLAGHGWAGGYGYHRPSAALQVAFESAGVKLSQDIDGRGDSTYAPAMAALARALGYTGPLFFVSHG